MLKTYRTAAWFVALVFLATVVNAQEYLFSKRLYWDTAMHYGQFRDAMHSFNVYGEPAWWSPKTQNGFPAYFTSILSLNFHLPCFAVVAAFLWALGKAGIHPTEFFSYYVFLIAFLQPLVFDLAMWALLRRLFRDTRVRVYGLVLAAFSPCVVFNLSDVTYVETCAYGLFFAAAYIGFLQRPSRRSFARLAFATCLVAMTLNQVFLYWNAVALPALILVSGLVPHAHWRRTARAISSISPTRWALTSVCAMLCALPCLLAFAQRGDLVRRRLGALGYDILQLHAGNPIEFFTVSSPGIGFDWAGPWRTNFSLLTSRAQHISYGYLGILCLPLFLVGLWSGRHRLRFQLIALVVVIFGCFNLSSLSPFVAILQRTLPMLSANTHFADALFRGGGCVIAILGACLGVETVLRRPELRVNVAALLLSVAAVTTVLYVAHYRGGVLGDYRLGKLILFTTLAIALISSLGKSRRATRAALGFLLALTLFDVATECHFYHRACIPQASAIDDMAAADGISLADTAIPYFHLNYFLQPRAAYDLWLRKQQPNLEGMESNARWENYNTVHYRFSSATQRTVTLRQTYSPYWTLSDGDAVRRSREMFTAVPIEAGESTITMHFRPPGIALSLWLCYFSLAGSLLAWLVEEIPLTAQRRGERQSRIRNDVGDYGFA